MVNNPQLPPLSSTPHTHTHTHPPKSTSSSTSSEASVSPHPCLEHGEKHLPCGFLLKPWHIWHIEHDSKEKQRLISEFVQMFLQRFLQLHPSCLLALAEKPKAKVVCLGKKTRQRQFGPPKGHPETTPASNLTFGPLARTQGSSFYLGTFEKNQRHTELTVNHPECPDGSIPTHGCSLYTWAQMHLC